METVPYHQKQNGWIQYDLLATELRVIIPGYNL
jgi:hypothetical protein